MTRIARLERGELDLLLGALDRLLERDPQVVAQIRAGLRAPTTSRRRAGRAAEEGIEDVGEATEPLEPGSTRTAIDAGPPERVVARPPVRIGQDLVRLVDLLEAFLGLGLRVDVGMPLLGELAEGAL